MSGSLIRPVSAFVAAFAIVACGEVSAPRPHGPAIEIVPVVDSVFEGDTVHLAAQVLDQAGAVVTNAPVTWTVSDTTLAEVLGEDVLVLLRPGTVRITASSDTLAATYDLVIGRLVVRRVELTPGTINMGRTDRLAVAARALGQGDRAITGRSVTFTSDDSLVAIVPGPGSIGSIDTGLLIAVGAGSTTIRGSVDGVTGTAQVSVVVLDTTLVLTHYNGSPIPALVAADSVIFNGVKEYDELYADAGTLVLSGLLQKRYQLGVRYSQYHVYQAGDSVQRDLRLRIVGERDLGIVTTSANGDLTMLSEFIGPYLEHTATLQPDGYLMHYHIPGENAFLDLRYVRVAP